MGKREFVRSVAGDLLFLLPPLLIGFALWCTLSSCVSSQAEAEQRRREVANEVAKGMKEASPFLPPPFNYVAELGASILVAGFGAKKVAHHVAKRRAIKAAAKAVGKVA